MYTYRKYPRYITCIYSWSCVTKINELTYSVCNTAHTPNHALILCAYLCANTHDSSGNSCQRWTCHKVINPHDLSYWARYILWPRGTSCDWSRVSCVSAQRFTVSCLPASPARLWVLVWQGIAAYQTGQAQLLLCCVPMKYVLWGLLLDKTWALTRKTHATQPLTGTAITLTTSFSHNYMQN